MNTYAVGDIHGCFDALRLVLDRIERHAGPEPARIVLLGDYVNIGPDSRKVLDFLIERPDLLALRGNHDMMLAAAVAGDAGSIWNFEYHGGGATLRSFGVARAREIPRGYVDFIRQRLLRYVEDALRVFVHASVDPALPDMALQDDLTLLWAKTPYGPPGAAGAGGSGAGGSGAGGSGAGGSGSGKPGTGGSGADAFDRYVVHGHWPQADGLPEILPHRCNLDSFGCSTGVFTCGVFDDTQPDPIDILQLR